MKNFILYFVLFSVSSGFCQSEDTANTDQTISDTTFVNLKEYSLDFVYDMKYATEDNFLKSKVYDCGECYLRYKTVKALIIANEKFRQYGYCIVIFDCYRPVDIQKKCGKSFQTRYM